MREITSVKSLLVIGACFYQQKRKCCVEKILTRIEEE